MPKRVAAGNWKMNMTFPQARELAETLRAALADVDGVEKILCPPYVSLIAVAEALRGSDLRVGAQNMHWEPQGAFTGEVSWTMLRGFAQYVILGHSERRHLFGETDEMVARKVRAALENGLVPILCVGETLEERQAGRAEDVVTRQVKSALQGVEEVPDLVVAYEPVWAIGTGVAATPETAAEIMGGPLTEALVDSLGERRAADVPLLYGGSVNTSNIGRFMEEEPIDGALVGGASLKPAEFDTITRAVAKTRVPRRV